MFFVSPPGSLTRPKLPSSELRACEKRRRGEDELMSVGVNHYSTIHNQNHPPHVPLPPVQEQEQGEDQVNRPELVEVEEGE